MAFNGDTYRFNRYRREAWDYLARARNLRERQTNGTAFAWETSVPDLVFLARNAMHIALTYRRIRNLTKGA